MKRAFLESEKGVVLIGVYFLTTVVLGIGGIFLFRVLNDAKFAERELESEESVYLAEAGLAQAISTLQGDFTKWNDATAFPQTTLGTGTYDATVTDDNDGDNDLTKDSNGIVIVTSTGKAGEATRTIQSFVKGATPEAFEYAFFADDKIDLHNHGHPVATFGTRMHSNGDIRIDQGEVVTGEVTSVKDTTVGESGGGSGTAIVYGNVLGQNIEVTSVGMIAHRDASNGPDGLPGTADDITAAHGDATAEVLVTNQGTIEGTTTFPTRTPVRRIPFPLFNYDRFKTIAQTPGQGSYFATTTALVNFLKTQQVTPVEDTNYVLNGVIFVDDGIDLTIKPSGGGGGLKGSSLTVNGSLISTKTVDITAKFDLVPQPRYPAIVGKEGIKFAHAGGGGLVHITGVLYSELGEIHLHHNDPTEWIFVTGSEIAQKLHNCLYLTFTYDPAVKNVEGFYISNPNGGEVEVLSWQEL